MNRWPVLYHHVNKETSCPIAFVSRHRPRVPLSPSPHVHSNTVTIQRTIRGRIGRCLPWCKVSVLGASVVLSLFMPGVAHSYPTVSSYSVSGAATHAGTGTTSPTVNSTPVPHGGSLSWSTPPQQTQNNVSMRMNIFGIAQGTLQTSTSQPQSKISAKLTGTPNQSARVYFVLHANAYAYARTKHPSGAARADAKIILSGISVDSSQSSFLPEVRATQEVVSDPNRPPCSETEVDEDESPYVPPIDTHQPFLLSRDVTLDAASELTLDFLYEIQLTISGNIMSALCPSIAETRGHGAFIAGLY